MILITSGAGFIGSNFVLDWLSVSDEPVMNLDKLTYAGNLENLAGLQGDVRHTFVNWLYVKDHCSAIRRVLEDGRLGETYNMGGWNKKPNIEFLHAVCSLLDQLPAKADGTSYKTQVAFVQDRPGHDRRYAIGARKIEREQDWRPAETFETGIRKTVQWYLDNPEWVAKQYEGAAS